MSNLRIPRGRDRILPTQRIPRGWDMILSTQRIGEFEIGGTGRGEGGHVVMSSCHENFGGAMRPKFAIFTG